VEAFCNDDREETLPCGFGLILGILALAVIVNIGAGIREQSARKDRQGRPRKRGAPIESRALQIMFTATTWTIFR